MAKITLLFEEAIRPTISPLLHGHFAEHLGACIDGGFWVGPRSRIPNVGGIRTDVVTALKKIAPPVLRWPGGCFADDYHWEDGVGPREARPKRVNLWWGEVIEDNQFGTHEFLRVCRELGAEPYIAGNLGSGTPRELQQWVEYCNHPGGTTLADRRKANGSADPLRVSWWGVGNENWGCGGNFAPDDYATEYKRYATYLRGFGTPLSLVACGPNSNDTVWTRRFLEKLRDYGWPKIHALAAHYYCGTAGTATEYSVDEFYTLLHRARKMETLIADQRAAMDEFDPERKIALIVDEWGTWHPPTEGRNPSFLWQQNTIRDALVAAMTLDIFHRRADAVLMGNIAQTVNVLQAMVLTEGDKMIVTPTFHVFEMYRAHRGGESVPLEIETEELSLFDGERLPAVTGSASLRGDRLTVSLVNAHALDPAEVVLHLRGARLAPGPADQRSLCADEIRACNTFDSPDRVRPRESAATDPSHIVLPPASVTVIQARLGS